MKCKIQWIANNVDIPTPDDNDAIGIARATTNYPDGRQTVQEFPICACHLERMPKIASICPQFRSEWTFHPFKTEI